MDLTGAHYGALGVVGAHGTLGDFVHLGLDPDEAEAIGRLPQGLGVLGTITRQAATVRLDEISEHPDSVGFPEHHPEMHAFLGVPVRVGATVFGNLYLTEKEGGFTEQDEMLVQFLAIIGGAAISTMRMQDRLRSAALHEDRERIARDLHDSIIQDLFAVGLGLQSAISKVHTEPEVVHARIDEAVDRLDVVISELRRFIFDLRPPLWARRDLDVEIRKLVSGLAQPHGVPVEVSVGPFAPGEPSTAVADNLIAIIREAVSNALRHARPSTVTVDVWSNSNRVHATIIDDGAGFEPAATQSGLGLGNIARRVEEAGGRYTVDSTLGSGTRVLVELPVA
jgi:signal transduction histidine kinase